MDESGVLLASPELSESKDDEVPDAEGVFSALEPALTALLSDAAGLKDADCESDATPLGVEAVVGAGEALRLGIVDDVDAS
jgi:hypothetical protein